jgi:hypothetical protein
MSSLKSLAIRVSVLAVTVAALAACVIEDGHIHHWH